MQIISEHSKKQFCFRQKHPQKQSKTLVLLQKTTKPHRETFQDSSLPSKRRWGAFECFSRPSKWRFEAYEEVAQPSKRRCGIFQDHSRPSQ